MGTSSDLFPLLKITDTSLLYTVISLIFCMCILNSFFFQFLHGCVDELLNKRKTNNENQHSNVEWTKEEQEAIKRNVKNFFRQSAIENTIELDSSLPDKIKSALKSCYEVRKSEIIQALAKECVIRRGHNLVENFDWKLKWILGSSDLATIRQPLLQIDFHCMNIEKNTVNFEGNLEQVDSLITALLKVNKELNKTMM